MMLALVRHARTNWSGALFCGRSDPPLSLLGDQDALAIAAHLDEPAWDAIIASPARRAQQTAQAIADRIGAAVETDARLWETDFGQAEGLSFNAINERWPGVTDALLRAEPVAWPGGETTADFEARIRAVWRELATPSRRLVVVTHGGPLQRLIELALPRWPEGLTVRPGPGAVVRLTARPMWTYAGHWSPVIS